jgi:hypothetical protein
MWPDEFQAELFCKQTQLSSPVIRAFAAMAPQNSEFLALGLNRKAEREPSAGPIRTSLK